MPVLLEQLRAQTRDLHEGLHVHPVLAPLADPNIVFADYARALTAFHNAYSGLLYPHVPFDFPDPPLLKNVQLDMEQHAIQASPANAPLAFDTVSHAVGALYVKNGSALGGQLISRNLKASLGLEPGQDNRFFWDGTSGNWRAFVTGLAMHESDLNENAVVDGAIRLFERIGSSCDFILEMNNVKTAQ
jgi:heme oxygenase